MEWSKDKSSAEKKYGPISDWDTSHIDDMKGLFAGMTCYYKGRDCGSNVFNAT